MQRYIARRLLMLVPVLLGVSILIFLIMRVIPGDPAIMILAGGGQGAFTEEDLQAMRHKLGTDRPLQEQYLDWVFGLARLNVGNSLVTARPVLGDIGQRVPVTVEFSLLTVFISLLISIPIGVVSAARQDTWVDYIFRVVSVAGLSMPIFWTGTLVILFLVLSFGWMPPVVYSSILDDPLDNLSQVIWPALVMGYYFSAIVSRMTRSCMLEVLRQDYIRTARAKGLREILVLSRHALKNAVLPVITIVGVQFGTLMGGSVLMETIFVLPGMGSHLVESIILRDYPVVQTIILLIAAIFVLINLAIDIFYAWLDPRIHYA
ncbi:MAG: ABC transporter permease [Chloroflexi bacterium]|nr:ABC transporter permease [Chloroflexota bacterium]